MDERVYELLNDQINKELYSAYLYMSFADYYEDEGLSGFANWYMIQAAEERDHALIFRKYLLDNGKSVQLKSIDQPDKAFSSYLGPLEAALEHEKYVTSLINDIYAAAAEAQSNHPIAKSVMTAFGGGTPERAEVREIAGMGVEARTKEGVVRAGNVKLMKSIGIEGLREYAKSAVYVALDGKFLGTLLVADELKPGVRAAMDDLRAAGVSRLVMLTGDNLAIAKETAAEAGMDAVSAELLPQDKTAELERLMAGEEKKTAFVGDGINDAPVLTRADIGIAMGGIGSDAAIEAADVVIMTDEIDKIAAAIRIAVKTRWIVWENIVMALGFKIAVMLLAVFAGASVWFAIFADVGVALLAVANALRALKAPAVQSGGTRERGMGAEPCPAA